MMQATVLDFPLFPCFCQSSFNAKLASSLGYKGKGVSLGYRLSLVLAFRLFFIDFHFIAPELFTIWTYLESPFYYNALLKVKQLWHQQQVYLIILALG